jgi:hypothetical protein
MPRGPALVILAAGLGSRYGGPKQLAKVSKAGHALFDYAVFDALRAGFERVVFVVSAETERATRAHVEAGCARHADVRLAPQETEGRSKPWGTGHAILTARPFVDGPFGVVNADDYYGPQSFALLAEGLAQGGGHQVLIGFTLGDTLSAFGGVSRGLCLLDGDELREVVELHDLRRAGDGVLSAHPDWPNLSGHEVISTNLWGFRIGFFDVLGAEFFAFRDRHDSDDGAEFYIGDAVNSLVARGEGRVKVLRTPEQFFGMTYPEDLPGVQQQLAARIAAGDYPKRLWG